jgi:hypothetical protein
MVEKSGSLLLESLGELVEQVYHFKDHYFEDHDLEEAAAKSDKAIFWLLLIIKIFCLHLTKSYFFVPQQKSIFVQHQKFILHLEKVFFAPNENPFLHSQKSIFCTSKNF